MVAAPAALYGVGYSAAYEGRYSLRWLGAMLNLFLLATSLVPLADNVVTFLLTWEAMSVASYFLVLTERDEPETVSAANWYLGMTQVGLAFLLASFLRLGAEAPALDFADLRGAAAALPDAARGIVFALALVGFGSKAGLIPLHVWLPRAHPAAPSHVSALLSGVMIKLGIYGVLRVGLDLLGGGPAWWGVALIVLGAGSAVLGVLYALMEDDIKRLLAYSSVENMGIITLGVGAAFLFQSLAMPRAAALALAAALYHALNHAAFKGLLFLGAGSVLHATGTRNMNRHGGLIHRMPWTGPCFLLGAVAIAGLPPLNGFFSEWLLFQALLPGIGVASPLSRCSWCWRSACSRSPRAWPPPLREVLRDHLPRDPALGRGRGGARVARLHARGHGRAGGGLRGPGRGRAAGARDHRRGGGRALRARHRAARVPALAVLPDAGRAGPHVTARDRGGPAGRARGRCGSWSASWPRAVRCASPTRGAAGAWGRRRAWSTPRPRTPSRCAASSRRSTARPRT